MKIIFIQGDTSTFPLSPKKRFLQKINQEIGKYLISAYQMSFPDCHLNPIVVGRFDGR